MIEIKYNRADHLVIMDGHAKSGEKGHDLVCAAASILAYTLVQNANAMYYQDEKHYRKPVTVLEEGRSMIQCKPNFRMQAVTTMVMDCICMGFDLLERQYPEFVKYEVI